MARNSVDDWSATPDDNTDIGGTNIAEGCPPGNMNNGLRKMMAQVRTWANSLKFVSYVAQALTNDEKAQARANIGALDVNLASVADKAAARNNLGLGRTLPTVPSVASAGTDLNTITTPGFDQLLHIGTQPNGWGAGDYAYILVLEYSGAQITQFAFPYVGGAPRFRDRYAGNWSAWKTLAHVIVSNAAPSGTQAPGEIWVQI